MSRKIIIIGFFFLYTNCNIQTWGQEIAIKTYTANDGLVANPVRRIFQDSKGFIWIATWEGLSKYDGHKFTNFNTANGLSHDLVNDVWELDNKLFVAQNNGFVDIVQNDAVSGKPLTEKLLVNQFHQLRGGKILVITDFNGICEFRKDHFVKPPQDLPNSSYHDLVDINDSLFLCIERGLGILWLFNRDYKLSTERKVGTELTCGYKDSKKRIWIGTDMGLKLLQPITNDKHNLGFISLPKQFAIPALQNAYICDVMESSKGDFWIGTTQGLLRMKPDGSSYLLTKDDGLPSETVTCIFEDREKNIWIGTSQGLAKFVTANSISFYSAKTGLIADNVVDLTSLENGELLISTGKGVQQYKPVDRRFTIIPSDNDVPYYLFAQRPGPFLFYLQKMYEYDSFRQRIVSKSSFPLSSYCIASDAEGNIFSGTDSGLFVYPKNAAATTSLKSFRITSLLLSQDGDLWVGTWYNGLYRIHYEVTKNKVSSEVKDLTHQIKVKEIRSFFKDSNGNIWIGTRYDGAFRLSKKNNEDYHVTHIDQAAGLISNWVLSFAEDKDGSIWIGTRLGLDKLVFQNENIRVFNFSVNNNFFGQIEKIIPSSGSTIWCRADGRLVEFSDEQLENQLPLPVYITSVILGDGSQNKSRLTTDTTISLKHYQNQLHFEFSAPGFINEKQILYSYRLIGSNDVVWSNPSNEHSVSYASLRPGDYRFEVRTLGWNMQWGKSTYFSFIIKPPFWQTWWFIGICVLFVGSLLYAFYRYRINQVKKMQRVRNRIATDLHDDIGSTLTNISILSELGNKNLQQPQQASKYLERIAEEVNASGQALDDIIWSVNSKNDTPEEMLVRMRRFAAELFDHSNVQCKLELKQTVTGKKMNMEQRRDLYLIYKESLNNIYKHAHAQKVNVELSMNKTTLTLTISDDGKGFNPQLVTERNGLKNLKTRAEKWKGDIVISSQPQGGSAISVTMPVKD